jgi:heme-degrading monooxygenase HmoA
MAVLMILDVPGGSPDQYDRVNEILGIRGSEDAPEGLVSHVAGRTDDGMLVVDVWESEGSLQRFVEQRLAAALADAGMPLSEPRVLPVHNHIAQGAGTSAGVIMMAELDALTPVRYDRIVAGMDAHVGDGSRHPAVSHVAGVTEAGGILVVDVWDSAESFGRFAETQMARAAEDVDMGSFEPRFVPVHNRLRDAAEPS